MKHNYNILNSLINSNIVEKLTKISGIALAFSIISISFLHADTQDSIPVFSKEFQEKNKEAFQKADAAQWQIQINDPGTEDWNKHWFLDGEVAAVVNTADGMRLSAGPRRDDTHHMVLWSRKSFKGDVKIEFEYTRKDMENDGVNILYIQATGIETPPYGKDITTWNKERRVPAMANYYNLMNTYHISYAAAPGTDNEYVRARRYIPGKVGYTGLHNTEIMPDYFMSEQGFFKPGVPHRFTVIKHDDELFMRIENSEKTLYMHWKNTKYPEIYEGNIGIRHMWKRSALYKDIKIYTK